MPRAARTLSLLIFLLVSAGVGASEKSVLVFGDSLSAAYGIAQSRGWVALLGERLKREHPDYIVVNESISGETSAGGISRIATVLKKHSPRIVVVELGANDGLRGLPVAQMKKNLAAIIEQAQKAGARVLVVGMKLPPNYGPDYAQAFESSFADLSRRYKSALLPFLLEGIAEKPEFFQPDRLHPTAEAQPLIAERVWKSLQPLLKGR